MLRLAASLADGIPVDLRDALVGLDARNADLVTAVRKAAPDFQADLPPGGDAHNRYMDLTRTSSEVGYTPRIGVEKGLAEYVEWLRTHPF